MGVGDFDGPVFRGARRRRCCLATQPVERGRQRVAIHQVTVGDAQADGAGCDGTWGIDDVDDFLGFGFVRSIFAVAWALMGSFARNRGDGSRGLIAHVRVATCHRGNRAAGGQGAG